MWQKCYKSRPWVCKNTKYMQIYTKIHWIAHSKWVNFLLGKLSLNCVFKKTEEEGETGGGKYDRSEEFLEPLKVFQKISSRQLYYCSQVGGFPDEVQARTPEATSLYLQVEGLPNSLTLSPAAPPPIPITINHSAWNTRICRSLKFTDHFCLLFSFLLLSASSLGTVGNNEPLVFLLKK